jgi:hypothetical protein
VDGGIMDNLPLDAIANFLDRAGETEIAAETTMITKEPESPHLMVGASLEVNAPPYALTFTRERLKSSWQRLRTRAKQLSYNTKLDSYEHAEQAIRFVHKPGSGRTGSSEARSLLSLQLVSIKPNWLCGTFAVHPMLGFRRKKQMRSIAHGCASTIRRFVELHKEDPGKYASWGLSSKNFPVKPLTWSESFEAWKERGRPQGQCWLRANCTCPFSRVALEAVKPDLEPALIDEVSKIYKLCPQPETHLRKV